MSLSMYEISVPTFVRMLRQLSGVLDKGVADAKANDGSTADAYLEDVCRKAARERYGFQSLPVDWTISSVRKPTTERPSRAPSRG